MLYDHFDNDMLDLGHPLRWKPRPVSELGEALTESLVAGLSNTQRLTHEFCNGIIAPWNKCHFIARPLPA